VLAHVTIRVGDREASERFYGLVLSTLGIERTGSGEEYAEWHDFLLARASAEHPATRRLHIGFAAPSRAHVDEFWRVGTIAVRVEQKRASLVAGEKATENVHLAFGADNAVSLLDPDGNSVELVTRDRAGEPSVDFGPA
jgi:catechol 2,3-dioxygenase-like lactoylglutathione lyase family enzyme